MTKDNRRQRSDLLPAREWRTLSNSEQYHIKQLAESLTALRPLDWAANRKDAYGFTNAVDHSYGPLAALLVGWAVISDEDRDKFWADPVLADCPDWPRDWRRPPTAAAATELAPATPRIEPRRGRPMPRKPGQGRLALGDEQRDG
jgi:hypothetical protein